MVVCPFHLEGFVLNFVVLVVRASSELACFPSVNQEIAAFRLLWLSAFDDSTELAEVLGIDPLAWLNVSSQQNPDTSLPGRRGINPPAES